jgi:hypothetical protein
MEHLGSINGVLLVLITDQWPFSLWLVPMPLSMIDPWRVVILYQVTETLRCTLTFVFGNFGTRLAGWWCNNHLEKYESQWEGLSHI